MSRPQRLAVALILNLSLVVALVIVGETAHSLGVIAAGGDYLADAAGIGVALLAYRLAHRYPRVHVIAALLNGSWLLVLSVLVGGVALLRLFSRTTTVRGLPVVIVSSIALIVMVIAALILKTEPDDDVDGDDDLSARAILLDTLADAAAAAGVALTGGVILVTHRLFWLDPGVALVIATVIGFHALRLLRDVMASLRQ